MLATNLLILRYSIEPNVFSIDKQDVRKRSMQSSRQVDPPNREDNNIIIIITTITLSSHVWWDTKDQGHARSPITITIHFLYASIVATMRPHCDHERRVLKYRKKASKRCAYRFRRARKELYTRTSHRQKIWSSYRTWIGRVEATCPNQVILLLSWLVYAQRAFRS